MEYCAHSVEGRPECEWQLLSDHLNNVAELAERFARVPAAIVHIPRTKGKPDLLSLLREGKVQKCFAADVELYVLSGDAYYQGGLNRYGMDFAPDYSEAIVL